MARTQFAAEIYDKRHRRNIAVIEKRLRTIYEAMYRDAAKIGIDTHFHDAEKEFYLKDFPQAEKRIDALLHSLAADVEGVINDGIDKSFDMSSIKNTAMVAELASEFALPKKRVQEWSRRNVAALGAFKQRKVNGMGLSERVWDFVKHDKQKLEMALELGLADGKSAAALSRDVREYLNEPKKLFRRVRDKDGKLRLSKAAQAYHPGQGVYRSSYKNALRMTITETNMAYKSADHDQWSGIPFVIGQTVKLSNNHTCKGVKGVFFDICDELQGDYPKDFKFVGWHPHCRCYVIAKLPDREEMRKWSRMTDEEQAAYHFKGEVTEPPKNFHDWMEKNADRIENAKSVPYFIKDNPKYARGNRLTDEQRRQITLEKAKQRHEERTAEQVADIQTRWNRHRIESNGDGYNLTSIERSINKYGVDRAEFDALMARPLKYDKHSYEFPELVALEDKYRDLADINVTKAVMKRGELYDLKLKAEQLGAKGKKYADRIGRHISQIDKKSNATKYWLTEKEAQQIASAKAKIAEMTKHREEVLKAWQERRAGQSRGIFDKIANADSPEALAKLMKDARIAKDFDLGNMPLDAQKTVAEVAAKMQSTYGLEPIDIRMKAFPKKNSSTFMWAHGGHVELNSTYWAKDALDKTTSLTFDNCVTNWKERHENIVLKYKQYIEEWQKKLAATDDAWDKKSYEKLIKQHSKEIEKEKKMLDTGMSRHNVFLSKETMLRDCFTHETGHTVHDQILGGINGSSFRQRRFNAADTNIINEEFKVLYRRHKRLGGGWLSEYGLTDWQEFMSESMVLYTHAPEKLPADVKAWFDLLGDYAKTGKLPARDKMPSVAFKPEKKKAILTANGKSSSAPKGLTPQEKDAIYARPIDEQWTKSYKGKNGEVRTHLAYRGADDVDRVMDVAKAFADQYGNCDINCEVWKELTDVRSRLFPELPTDSKANPDLRTKFGLVDVKSPTSHLNFVSNANVASRDQHSIACITTHRMAITEQQLRDRIEALWKEEDYKHDILFVYHNGVLTKYNRPK